MKSIVYYMLVLIGLTACNNNETTTPEPANVDSNNTAEQTDIASHNSINTLADAMNNFVFDLEDMQLSGDADADFAQVIIRHQLQEQIWQKLNFQ